MKRAKLKLYASNGKQYIYVYCKYKGNLIRINTGNEFIKSYMQSDLLYNKKHPQQKELNGKTKDLLGKVDEYINHSITNNKIPQQRELKAYLAGEFVINTSTSKSKDNGYTSIYNDFLKYKRNDDANINSDNSLRTYTTLQKRLDGYATYRKQLITIDDINNIEFLNGFISYLNNTLHQNTIVINLKYYKVFLRYLHTNKHIQNIDTEILSKQIKRFNKPVVALTEEELNAIYLHKYLPKERVLVDMFVLMCYTGVRYGDYADFKSFEIVGNYLVKYNNKTQTQIKIPILPVTKQILSRYDKIPTLTNAGINIGIKRIMNKYKLLDTPINTFKKKLGNGIVAESTTKSNVISAHTARKTFITICINNNVPVNAIALATGHTTTHIFQTYIAKETSLNYFDGIGANIDES